MTLTRKILPLLLFGFVFAVGTLAWTWHVSVASSASNDVSVGDKLKDKNGKVVCTCNIAYGGVPNQCCFAIASQDCCAAAGGKLAKSNNINSTGGWTFYCDGAACPTGDGGGCSEKEVAINVSEKSAVID